VPPSRSLLVCATPRSGSTLLCESLAATGVAGCPREDFEALAHSRRRRGPEEYFTGLDDREVDAILAQRPDPEPPAAVPEPYEAFLQDAVARGTTANGVFATKLMWGYLGDFLALVRRARPGAPADDLALLLALFPAPEWIWVRRDDVVRQAVSLWRAVQTAAWRAEEDGGRGQLAYSRAAIAHLARQLTEQDAAWGRFFAGRGLQPIVVTYEEELADGVDTVTRRLLRRLGLPDAQVPEPPLRRQADAVSERWVERFRDEQ